MWLRFIFDNNLLNGNPYATTGAGVLLMRFQEALREEATCFEKPNILMTVKHLKTFELVTVHASL